MPAIVLLGNRGSGKNIFVVNNLKDSERTIESNFGINLPNYKPLSFASLLHNKKPREVVLDEAYTYIESRTSMKYGNMLASYLLFQLRKLDVNIYIMVQDFSTVDIRFRNQWDYLIICSRKSSTIKRKEEWDFKYTIIKKVYKGISIGFKKKSFIMNYDYAKKNLFHLYDTNEIVDPQDASRIEYEILKTQPKRFAEQSLKLAGLIKPKLKNITMDSVKTACLIYGVDDIWAKNIYLLLKNYINIK